ncbi:hypothetical protein ES708_35013 [subsurface metagenome]
MARLAHTALRLVPRGNRMVKRAIDEFKSGDFNRVFTEILPDGSQLIALKKRGRKKVHKCRVKNLYQSNEEELNIESGKPITKRD